MPKVDAECPISVIYDFPGDEQVEFDGFDVGVEVPPAEHLLKFSGFHDGPAFGAGLRSLYICLIR